MMSKNSSRKSLRRHKKKKSKGEVLSPWSITYLGFDPCQEGLREALCTLGNGYMGVRGASPQVDASDDHYPGMYLAGLYNKTPTKIAGRTIYNEDMVNCPNWIHITFRIGEGEWFTPKSENILEYSQELDMRAGCLKRKMRVKDSRGRITLVETERIVSMKDPHLAAIRHRMTPLNYDGYLSIKSTLDGTVKNWGVKRYRELNCQHLKHKRAKRIGRDGIALSVMTTQSKVEIAEASVLRCFSNGREIKPKFKFSLDRKAPISQELWVRAKRKKKYDFEKVVAVYTSRDAGVQDPFRAAIRAVRQGNRFETLKKEHAECWNELWRKFDVEIEGDLFSQAVLRLHIFHLLQTASLHNSKIDAGLPARGLHGEAYRGHVFWDELFVMSLFDLHAPEISKALLRYRYERLPKSRKYATQNGYRGAMFAWQSGSTGVEETQIVHLNPMSGEWGPDASRIQRHVSFAIAYNMWAYWQRTGDLKFFSSCGAEVLLSIAQFGASLAKFDKGDRRYHTDGIMGPDEFHEYLPGAKKPGFRDNAYTNLMIVWTLLRSREALEILPASDRKRLIKKLGITRKELTRWDNIIHQMNVYVASDGVISQFDGYFRLKELNWDAYRKKYGKIGRLDRILKAEGKSPDDYKVSKQADLLMLFYILPIGEIEELFNRLGYVFDPKLLTINYHYYEPRTSHGSTLSKVVHGYCAHLMGKSKVSWDWFLEVCRSDIHDTQGGTTPEGIHCGVMGGSLDMVQRAFAGVHILSDRVKINPRLPKAWRKLHLKLFCRGHWMEFWINHHRITCVLESSPQKPFPLPVEIGGKRVDGIGNQKRSFSYRSHIESI